jgi:glutathione S-transferase
MLKVISATPSPYARKVRIALLEKGIPFELVTDVPWNDDTIVRNFNPLEKLPILVTETDGEIYDSALILDYIEWTWAYPPLLPPDARGRLVAKQVEVLQNGICDSTILTMFERQRGEGKQSEEWLARQRRKIERGVAELARLADGKDFIVGGKFSLADIAAGTALGYLSLRFPEFDWRAAHPDLVRYFDRLAERPSFKATVPSAQNITAKVA